jgi:hypothetical protein
MPLSKASRRRSAPEEIARVCQDALLACSLAGHAPRLQIASRGSAGMTSLSFFGAARRLTIGAS